jgi:hypothetical protein
MDTTNLLNRQQQFSSDVAQLINFAYTSGFKATLKECLRVPEMEEIYKKQNLSWLDDFSKDYHLNSLAIDICFFINDVWITDYSTLYNLGVFWIKLTNGNVWGGQWKVRDLMHFQGA